MSTRKAVIIGVVWALSLIGVSVWAQSPTEPQGGVVYVLGGGRTTGWRIHADDFQGGDIRQPMTYRGNVTITLPDAPHFVLLADEAILAPGPTKPSGAPTFGEELHLQGNVRLKVVRP